MTFAVSLAGLCVWAWTGGDRVGPDWVRLTEDAGWRARDSQGEVVFGGKLWILGGWFDSFEPTPRDVWSSVDGKVWERVVKEAEWKHGDLPMTLVFGDAMWLMGGWHNGRMPGYSASCEVWRSTDGANWEQVAKRAGWSARLAAGATVFRDQMWILGGTENYYFGDASSLKNDVWCSDDGKEWKCVTENAGWSPRAYHQAVAHDGKLWVLGGGNYVPEYHAKNDVWSSEDGEHWSLVCEHAPWHSRLWFSAVVYRDHIWVLGGWSNDAEDAYRNWGDVWYSKDGKDWKELKSKVVWKARHEHSAFVFDDRIIVAGGHAQPLTHDVWSLEIPDGWFAEE